MLFTSSPKPGFVGSEALLPPWFSSSKYDARPGFGMGCGLTAGFSPFKSSAIRAALPKPSRWNVAYAWFERSRISVSRVVLKSETLV